jgi:diguanylate cyclase (GGDEF)-like protein/PAS domain S-box-containing protein
MPIVFVALAFFTTFALLTLAQIRKGLRADHAVVLRLNEVCTESHQIIENLTLESTELNALMQQVSIHFNEFFQKIPAPCFCFDSDARIKEWNRAFENLTLIDSNGILDQSVSKIVRVDADPYKMNNVVAAVYTGETFEGIELHVLSAGGPDKIILCNIFPLRGEEGIVTAAICAGIDITERIHMERRMLNHVEMLSAAQMQLEEQHSELVAANEKLEMLAMSDSLTGLKNHRALQERLQAEFKRSVRYSLPISVLLIDVDLFKSYNDTYGHLAGDTVLRIVANLLTSSMRDTDFVARYGGEEFVVILPHTAYKGALEAAERVRTAVERATYEFCCVTVSIGISTLVPNMECASDLIASADLALYYCKQHGRNQVIHSQELPRKSEDAGLAASSLTAEKT